MQPNIFNTAERQSLLESLKNTNQTFTVLVGEEPISVKRKQLELNLVREIEKAIAGGLDVHFIAINLGKVTNVTVGLKDEQSL